MEPEYTSKYNSYLIRIVIIVILLVGGVIGANLLFAPKDFGEHGHFRSSAVKDEMNRPIRNQTNDSCLGCHPYVKNVHLAGVHRTVSCEFCHGPNSDHVREGIRVGAMPVKRNEDIRDLCLRCHNRIIRARPDEVIKMISMPQHLNEKKVRVDNVCNQCHHVHAPMKWVNESRQMMGQVGT